MVTARWGKLKFKVSKKKINSFTDLAIKGSIKTEEKTKTKSGQEVTTKKTTKATEVSFTAHLYASTGCNVRKESLRLVKAARRGKKAYLYIGGKKLVKYKLILTEASVKEVTFYGGKSNIRWYSADIALTFKQSTADNNESSSGSSSGSSGSGSSGGSGSTGSAGSGSNKASVKTKTPTSTSGKASKSTTSSGIDAVSSAQPASTKSKIRGALEVINQTRKAAKVTTKEVKTTKPTVVFDKKYGKQVM